MRLSSYDNPISYIRQEHGAETREEAARKLGRLLAEQDRIRVRVEDPVKAINAAWPVDQTDPVQVAARMAYLNGSAAGLRAGAAVPDPSRKPQPGSP